MADDARLFIDSMLTLVWTLAGSALTLVSIIGAFVTINYQLKATEAIKAYEDLARLQGFNDPSILEGSSEGEVKKRAGQVRKYYVSFANRLKMLNGSFGMDEKKYMSLLIPVFFVWAAGCILLVVRIVCWGAGNLSLIFQLLIIGIFPLYLVLLCFLLRRFISSSCIVKEIPSVQEALDAGYEGFDVLGKLLSTAGVYVTIENFMIKFSIYYAVPFHSYILNPQILFYNADNTEIAKLPTNPDIIKWQKAYQSDLTIQKGGRDSFMVQIPDGVDHFRFKLTYKLKSNRKINSYLFPINKIDLNELKNSYSAKFIECVYGWQIPEKELERHFNNNNQIIHLTE